jgi:uncharacterized protein
MAAFVYLDSSAIVKLVLEEAESLSLRDALRSHPQRVSSALAMVEVHLAAARRAPAPSRERVNTILAGLSLISVDQRVLESAARPGGTRLRALDAIHLATAATLGKDLHALIAYDQRMLGAARAAGLPTERPG